VCVCVCERERERERESSCVYVFVCLSVHDCPRLQQTSVVGIGKLSQASVSMH